MGREQSEKLNTSPSRGSGYQVINDLFDRQQDFIVVGLCGKNWIRRFHNGGNSE